MLLDISLLYLLTYLDRGHFPKHVEPRQCNKGEEECSKYVQKVEYVEKDREV